MKHLKKYKNLILICLTIGFGVALVFRLSFLCFTSDFERVYDNRISPSQRAVNEKNMNREVFGKGGFPISSFKDCAINPAGGEPGFLPPYPRCKGSSLFGEFSIFINTIFWGFFVYLILSFLKVMEEKISGGKK